VEPITIVAIGTLLGGVGQLIIQWPPLRKEGFRFRPVLNLRDESLHRVLLLMGPGTIGMAATQINVFVNTLLATGEGTGAVSWLDFAFRLMYLPIGLFGVSIAAAATPAISRMVAEKDFERIRSTLAHGLGLMFFLNLPATVGLIVLAQPIIALIFERGEFTPADTVATAAALQFYAIGLVGYSIVRIISPTFYALGRSRVPVMVSAGSVLVNIALNVTLVKLLGYRGLALGTSMTALINASIQLWWLRREIHGLHGSLIAASFGRVIVATAVMGAATWASHQAIESAMPGGSLTMQGVRLLVTISTALATLAIVAHFLRIPEFAEARHLVLGKLRRTRG
jgi:putative peptidoglycan lipid II flippase